MSTRITSLNKIYFFWFKLFLTSIFVISKSNHALVNILSQLFDFHQSQYETLWSKKKCCNTAKKILLWSFMPIHWLLPFLFQSYTFLKSFVSTPHQMVDVFYLTQVTFSSTPELWLFIDIFIMFEMSFITWLRFVCQCHQLTPHQQGISFYPVFL